MNSRTHSSARMGRRASILALVALLLLAALTLVGCQQQTPPGQESTPQTQETPPTETTEPETTEPETPSDMKDVTKLEIKDLKVGTGAEAKKGNAVTVNYTGWLTDGTKFDSSYSSGQPFTFPLGGGQVISGWDEGVAGMKVGGVRQLAIPPAMGYGEQGYPPTIPGNATLYFIVELLDVQ